MEAAEKVRTLSSPYESWVEPPDRVRPSLVAYFSGRPVVHASYVGYEYMFVGREEVEYRRHAVAHFWHSTDPAFTGWFLRRYAVKGVLATAEKPLPPSAGKWVEPGFSNEGYRLFRVQVSPGAARLESPKRLPLGPRGARFFGRGWSGPSRSPRTRRLLTGTSELYLPVPADAALVMILALETPHAAGELFLGGRRYALGSGQDSATLALPRLGESRLHRLELVWEGERALTVRRLEIRDTR